MASSGTIRIGRPQLTTIRAASGSRKMLNSAEAVAFPWSCAPPMITSSGIRSMIRGSLRIAVAMFVSGPTGTSVMSPSDAMYVSISQSTACCEPFAGARRRQVQEVAVDPRGRVDLVGVRPDERLRHPLVDRDAGQPDVIEHAEGVLGAVRRGRCCR